MIKLRDYQEAGVNKVLAALKKHQRVMAVSPTGSGKGTVIAYLMWLYATRGYGVMTVIHRKTLIKDVATRLITSQKLNCTLIMPGAAKTNYPAKIASIQTLINRKPPKDIKLLIIDEGHRGMASSYMKVVTEMYPDCKVVYFTATPDRADGLPFYPTITELIQFTTTRELIKRKQLVPLYYKFPKQVVDLRGVKRSHFGDFDEEEQFKVADDERLYAQIIEDYKTYMPNKPGIAFAVNKEHSARMADHFNKAGIVAKSIDESTPEDVRDSWIQQYKQGRIKVLVNCELFIEGFDVPVCAGVFVVRATQSVARWIQMAGRGARPVWGDKAQTDWKIDPNTGEYEKPYCFLFDYGNNTQELGHWETYDQFGFSLIPVEEKTNDPLPKTKQCPVCEYICARTDKECRNPECGEPFPSRGPLAGADIPDTFAHEVEYQMEFAGETPTVARISKQISKMSPLDTANAPPSLWRIIRLSKGWREEWLFECARRKKLIPADHEWTNQSHRQHLKNVLSKEEKRAGTYDIYLSMLDPKSHPKEADGDQNAA